MRPHDRVRGGVLVALVHDDLRQIAIRLARRERRTDTLHATALVNEAYLRLRNESRRLRRPMRDLAEAVILADDLEKQKSAGPSQN